MKIPLSLLASFLIVCQIKASTLTFSRQSQIDSFNLLYDVNIGGNLEIKGPDIYNIDSLYRVKSIFGNISVIETNIRRISVFEQVDSLSGINLKNNAQLESIIGFRNIIKIEGSITIEDCPLLSNISIFKRILYLGDISIKGKTTALDSITGFETLIFFGGLDIQFNNGVKTINGFNNCIIRGIHINNSHTLKSITGFNGLTEYCDDFSDVNFKLNIWSNDSLEYLDFLHNVKCSSRIYIQGNKNLKSIKAFTNLFYASDIAINSNFLLEYIFGFKKAEALKIIRIFNNPSIKILSCFDNATIIDNIFIADTQIEDFKGSFSKLDSMGTLINNGELQLFDNKKLTSIDEFSNLKYTNKIAIVNSPLLNYCAIPSICSHINENRKLVTSLNGIGCQSLEEIVKSCNVITIDENIKGAMIYPNPFTTFIEILLPGNFNNPNFKVYSISGMSIDCHITQLNNQHYSINTSQMCPGLYFIKIYDGLNNKPYKLIKI